MSNDNKVEVQFGAQTGDLESGSNSAAKAVQDALKRMRDSMSSVDTSVKGMHENFKASLEGMASSGDKLGGLAEKFAMLGEAIVGAYLADKIKDAISETSRMISTANGLGRQLDMTATEAGHLAIALDDVHVSTDEYSALAQGMARNLKLNEAAIKAMGLETRDANGNIRNTQDLIRDGAKILDTYKAGLDRSIAATQLFGRGATNIGTIMKAASIDMEAAREKADELGLTITKQSVQANFEYKNSMNDVHDVLDGLMNAIGSSLMPVITELGNWFSSVGPAAVAVVKGAFGGLAATFWYLRNGVIVLWETINAMVNTIAEPIMALGRAINKALHGDLTGAAQEMQEWPSRVAASWSQAMDNMTASSQETADKVYNIFAKGDAAEKELPSGKKGANTKDAKARLAEWKAHLTDMLEADGQYFKDSTQMQLEYWERIKSHNKLTVEEARAVHTAIFNLTKKRLSDELAEQITAINAENALYKERLNVKRAEIDQLKQDQQITDAEALRRHKALNDAEYESDRAALEQRLNLMGVEEKERIRIRGELDALEQKHNATVIKDTAAVSAAVKKSWEDAFAPIGTAFGKAMDGVIAGTNTIRSALRQMGQSIVIEYAQMGAKMVVNWASHEIAKTAASAAGAQARGGIEASAAAQSVALSAWVALKNIMNSAWEAMAGAYKAVAGIPFVGPVLAPVAAGVAFAGVARMAGNIASASGGYDIPAGVNPITQLHEKEMVLPAKQADAVRQMAEGGGSSQPAGQIRGMPPGQWLMVHRDDLVTALKSARRDFAFTKF